MTLMTTRFLKHISHLGLDVHHIYDIPFKSTRFCRKGLFRNHHWGGIEMIAGFTQAKCVFVDKSECPIRSQVKSIYALASVLFLYFVYHILNAYTFFIISEFLLNLSGFWPNLDAIHQIHTSPLPQFQWCIRGNVAIFKLLTK